MAMKKNWNEPTKSEDNKYVINVTTLAPLVEMTKGKAFEETGIESRGNSYSDIMSNELTEGITIAVEESKEEKTK